MVGQEEEKYKLLLMQWLGLEGKASTSGVGVKFELSGKTNFFEPIGNSLENVNGIDLQQVF